MSPRPPTWQEAGYRSHGVDVQKIGTKQVLSEYLDMQGGSGRVARAELIHDQRARRLESTNRWPYIVGRRSCGGLQEVWWRTLSASFSLNEAHILVSLGICQMLKDPHQIIPRSVLVPTASKQNFLSGDM